MNKLSTSSRDEKSSKRKAKWVLKCKYWIISLGACVVFCAYTSFLVLQSSIRIEDGLGTKLTATTFFLQIAVGFVFAPFILRIFGAKKCLIASEICYLIYTVVNAFSNNVLLVIGSVITAVANGIFWLPLGISFVYFAKKYSRISSKSEEDCVMEFSGILLGIFQLNLVLGNTISSIILNAFPNKNTTSYFSNNASTVNSRNFSNSFDNKSKINSSTFLNFTSNTSNLTKSSYSHLVYCGANDCQDPNITQKNIDQYVPRNPVAVYVLTGCLILLLLVGLIIHFFFLPDMPLELLNQQKKHPLSDTSSADLQEEDVQPKKSFKFIIRTSLQAAKDSFATFFNPRQLFLITPLAIYVGMQTGFVHTEFTRAYASCILGVGQVGVCIIAYSVSNSGFTFFIGKVLGKYGRWVLLSTGVTFDCSLYMFCLLWNPNRETTWVVYLLFCCLGVSNSIWQMLAATVFANKFFKSKEVSFNIWNITFGVGFGVEAYISPLLCVRFKLYIMTACVTIATILDGINILVGRRIKKRKKQDDEKVSEDVLTSN